MAETVDVKGWDRHLLRFALVSDKDKRLRMDSVDAELTAWDMRFAAVGCRAHIVVVVDQKSWVRDANG